ncbi:hypothetical protein [Sporosarcina cascadiensis]|uniref:hypothetical protein n=1 Tax=Sporosarcina cascadiensis TaxID=2660747 RepID=UPI00129AAC65|nr:hypothetical protein [Sporosarcina cascadiensis]
MRNGKIIFWTILFVCALPAVMHGQETEEVEQKADQRHTGIISGLVNTVTKTVDNTGEVVKQTVEATSKTLQQTADFAGETVKTIAGPPSEKPVTEAVGRTADFVRETVEAVQPAVNKTTETVQQTVKDTAGVTKELPEIPVVTPVVEETVQAVSETVGNTADYVDQTTDAVKSLDEKPVQQVLKNTGGLVSDTVETAVPVVETTTNTVESVSNAVTEAVNEVPVVSNTAPVIEETVSFTVDTLNRTAATVHKVVQNVTTPTEKPIRQTLKDTAALINETLSGTVPVVEKTTDLVKDTLQEVTQTTEKLPEIPVVTPVVGQVTEHLNGQDDQVKDVTDQTVTETVGQTNEIIQPAVGNPQYKPSEKPSSATQPVKPADQVKPAEKAEQIPMVPVQQSTVHSQQDTEKLVNESSEKLVKEEIEKKAAGKNVLQRLEAFELFTEQQERAPVLSDSSFRVELSEMNAEDRQNQVTGQLIPPVKENQASAAETPAIVVTSSSSTAVSAANGSHIDVSAGLWSEQLQAVRTISTRWYAEHILGKLQWTHPPPGQPPQATPFLYVSI